MKKDSVTPWPPSQHISNFPPSIFCQTFCQPISVDHVPHLKRGLRQCRMIFFRKEWHGHRTMLKNVLIGLDIRLERDNMLSGNDYFINVFLDKPISPNSLILNKFWHFTDANLNLFRWSMMCCHSSYCQLSFKLAKVYRLLWIHTQMALTLIILETLCASLPQGLLWN